MQKKLGKNWKKLHSLTYILPLLLLWHILSKMHTWSFFTRFNIFLLLSVFSLIIFRFILKVSKFILKTDRSLPNLQTSDPTPNIKGSSVRGKEANLQESQCESLSCPPR
jgi:DMSO/TMAO reductase YedYZ heme-binding membrane subunit